eukprot:gnl/Spiro4/2056_TR1006_c0_g1_i1.p3 gnl/Spiro4/2056_TR1006_c0_g1~~gnl/Spiro4/2056_TR1006_c0_g1_i1.p3  ORF type:complete len:144 (+),score=27.50 gnl/Spiro4/2056_TR1006_c0_g1_i1:39-434(+)
MEADSTRNSAHAVQLLRHGLGATTQRSATASHAHANEGGHPSERSQPSESSEDQDVQEGVNLLMRGVGRPLYAGQAAAAAGPLLTDEDDQDFEDCIAILASAQRPPRAADNCVDEDVDDGAETNPTGRTRR